MFNPNEPAGFSEGGNTGDMGAALGLLFGALLKIALTFTMAGVFVLVHLL